MGERGDPWGTPKLARSGSEVKSSKLNVVCLSLRKLCSHRTIGSGMRLFLRLCRRRSWETVGNACDISRKRVETTFFCLHASLMR